MDGENGCSSTTFENGYSKEFTDDTSTPQTSHSFQVNTRLWRPAAQRNLKNQWLKLASLRHDWSSSSAAARSHATALVNSFLSQTYMTAMDLGVLSDMPGIRHKASQKLFKQQSHVTIRGTLESEQILNLLFNSTLQELQRKSLFASYKDMVGIAANMANVSRSMRCYSRGSSSSPVAQFSFFPDNENDTGDGGGIAVFKFLPISQFEAAAENYVQMFVSELNLKRFLVIELSSMGDKNNCTKLHWSNELYPGEFGDIRSCNLYSEDAAEPIHPSLVNLKSEVFNVQPTCQLDWDGFQVYLTVWISEVNIVQSRIDEILDVIGCEMQVTLS